jgi:hypothetical protein
VPGLWRSRAAGALAAHLAAPRPPALIRSALILIAVVAAVLLLAGALLIYITRRRPRHAARSRSRSPT